jgi:hypothetical protein
VAEFSALLLNRGSFSRLLIRRSQALAILLLEPVRLLEQRACLMPDRGVQQICAHLVVAAYALAPESIRISSQAAVIGIAARMMLAGGGADRLAVEGVAAVRAADQPLQEVPRTAEALSGMAAVLL